MKQTLKIGISALVIAALTMSGIALAQTGDDDTTDEEAAAPGVSVIVERLAPLIEDGTITEPQAEAVAKQLADGFGPRRGHGRGVKGMEVAAAFLGMEIEDLGAELRDGATLAGIAGDQTDGLIAAMVADAEEHLAQAVADGKLTQEEADEKLAEIEERISTFVNEGPPERPEGQRGPGGPRGQRGPGGFGPGGSGAPVEGAETGA